MFELETSRTFRRRPQQRDSYAGDSSEEWSDGHGVSPGEGTVPCDAVPAGKMTGG